MQLIRKIVEGILYSNIFIGFCAVALTFTNQLTVDGKIHFDIKCWFIFFSTIFTYSYLKVIGPEGNAAGTAHRSWAKDNKLFSRIILIVSLIGTIAFFIALEHNAKLIVLALGALTAFYGFVSIPFTRPSIKLRDLGLVKTLFVAIVWSVTTVIIPFTGEYVSTDMMIFLLLRRFLFLLGLTMAFEIKDIEGDRQYKLRTLPIAIGIAKTKALAQAVLFALFIINIIQYLFFTIPLNNMIALNFSVLLSIFCIQPLKEETGDKWYYGILDGMMILQFIFVFIGAKFFA